MGVGSDNGPALTEPNVLWPKNELLSVQKSFCGKLAFGWKLLAHGADSRSWNWLRAIGYRVNRSAIVFLGVGFIWQNKYQFTEKEKVLRKQLGRGKEIVFAEPHSAWEEGTNLLSMRCIYCDISEL